MANPEHLKMLDYGVQAWNLWREDYPDVIPDLSNAPFAYSNLPGANFRSADLTKANLREANLAAADFGGAILTLADVSGAALEGATLANANLGGAILTRAHLAGADLTVANLTGVKLDQASLVGANFREACLMDVDFSASVFKKTKLNNSWVGRATFAQNDLSQARGLETVNHTGPSEVSRSTLLLSKGGIPDTFLRGCGLFDWEIESARLYEPGISIGKITEALYRAIDVRANPLIQFYSCFISYSSKDQKFAERLHNDLQAKGVRVWFAPHDLPIGAKIRPAIDESIRLHDKLLLVLSEASVTSQWVEQEVETALAREREPEGKTVLFPVRIDDAVMDIGAGWPALIKHSRNVGDFTRWKEHDSYQRAFERLLRDLKAGA